MTREPGLNASDVLRVLAIALILFEAGIHLQQYEGPLRSVPTINTLFVLNALGGAAIALVLVASRREVAVLAALAGLGLTLGALVSLAIARTSTLFAYSEPILRPAVLLASLVELAAALALVGFVLTYLGDWAGNRARSSAADGAPAGPEDL